LTEPITSYSLKRGQGCGRVGRAAISAPELDAEMAVQLTAKLIFAALHIAIFTPLPEHTSLSDWRDLSRAIPRYKTSALILLALDCECQLFLVRRDHQDSHGRQEGRLFSWIFGMLSYLPAQALGSTAFFLCLFLLLLLAD